MVLKSLRSNRFNNRLSRRRIILLTPDPRLLSPVSCLLSPEFCITDELHLAILSRYCYFPVHIETIGRFL